jgi:uncharacterized membrane protein
VEKRIETLVVLDVRSGVALQRNSGCHGRGVVTVQTQLIHASSVDSSVLGTSAADDKVKQSTEVKRAVGHVHLVDVTCTQ